MIQFLKCQQLIITYPCLDCIPQAITQIELHPFSKNNVLSSSVSRLRKFFSGRICTFLYQFKVLSVCEILFFLLAIFVCRFVFALYDISSLEFVFCHLPHGHIKSCRSSEPWWCARRKISAPSRSN